MERRDTIVVKRLILISSGLPDGRVELTPGRLPAVMGRSRDVDITITDGLLSRRHAEVRMNAAGDFELHDLESTNLTIVNEKDVSSHVLATGDRILLGDTEIAVQIVIPETEFNEQTTREIDAVSDGSDG